MNKRLVSCHGSRTLYLAGSVNLKSTCSAVSQQLKLVWPTNLHPVGLHYYAGMVDSNEELLECHKVATQSSFETRSSTKKATGHIPGNKENCDPQEGIAIMTSQVV